MTRSALLVSVLGVVACSSPSQGVMPMGGGGTPSGTVVSGTMTFSTMYDRFDKFDAVQITQQGRALPQLVLLDEATLGTGECSMLALADGATEGASGWEFAAPSGKKFRHVDLRWSTYVDHRADSATGARAVLITD